MSFDARDQLWNSSYRTYYASFFEELAADKMINRWQMIDEATRLLVALTASGSALSGWALWSEPKYRAIWAAIAGIGAILAIIHTTLGVPGRLKDWGDVKRTFANLRIQLETFHYRMAIDPQFDVKSFTDEFVIYRKQYADSIQIIRSDVLRTQKLVGTAQTELDRKLAKENTDQGGLAHGNQH